MSFPGRDEIVDRFDNSLNSFPPTQPPIKTLTLVQAARWGRTIRHVQFNNGVISELPDWYGTDVRRYFRYQTNAFPLNHDGSITYSPDGKFVAISFTEFGGNYIKVFRCNRGRLIQEVTSPIRNNWMYSSALPGGVP